jgi:tetratricopeptide (TPR) repeat protein
MPYFRGLVDQKAGDFSNAEAEFVQALQTRHEPFAGAHLVEIWLKQGRYAEILSYLKTGQRLDEGLARKLIAAVLLNVRPEESPHWFEVVKQRYPGALLLASQNFMQAGRYNEAAVWSSAVTDPAQQMEGLLVTGISSFYLGRLDQAESVFKQLHETKPIPDVEYWYGRLLTVNGRPQLGVPILEASVRDASAGLLPWALRELGSAYALAGRCQDADTSFSRSIHVDNSIDNQERIQQARKDLESVCSVQ